MSGVHCEKFPTCMELGLNATVPSCSKPDCPGAFRSALVEAMFAPQGYDGSARPQGTNADEWNLFLVEHKDAVPYVAVQIAEAIEGHVEREAIRAHDFEIMMARLVYRIERGMPLVELLAKAKDLQSRRGTLSPLREDR